MRETIAEACKTIEDNQTAQALHGLLSLKAESHEGAVTLTASAADTTVLPGAVTTSAGIDLSSLPSSAPINETASAALIDVAKHITGTVSNKTVGSEQQLMKSLEKARICNSEVLNVSQYVHSDIATVFPWVT